MDEVKVRIVWNRYGYYRGAMAGSVFDTDGLAPSLTCNGGGNREPMAIEYDRSQENPQ
jgi:hypothetical protein